MSKNKILQELGLGLFFGILSAFFCRSMHMMVIHPHHVYGFGSGVIGTYAPLVCALMGGVFMAAGFRNLDEYLSSRYAEPGE